MVVDYKFINPYNFVRVDFDKKPDRRETPEHKGLRSGVMHCRLIAKTPIAIPNVNDDNYFMRTKDDKPFIPGSSIRGPIRSVFEALTNSCMSTVDKEEIITYRTKDAFKPGLIYKDEEDKMHLFSAKRYIFGVTGRSYAPFYDEPELECISETVLKSDYQYGEKVFIKPVLNGNGKEEVFWTSKGFRTKSIFIRDLQKEQKGGYKEGYICIGEPFGRRKHFESVFTKVEEIEGIDETMLKNSVKRLKNIIDIYNDDKINKNAKKGKIYQGVNHNDIDNNTYYPVWYTVKEEKGAITNVHLSVANIGRAAYNKNMGEKIHHHKACESRQDACDACRLFGLATSGDNKSAGSRVRFTDAVMKDPIKKGNRVVLKELSSPKPSYMPFYLRNNSGSNKTTPKDWSYDNVAMDIRGRKFYWHTNPEYEKAPWLDPSGKLTDRNAKMELLKNGYFDFSVYFDNVDDDELDKLIWTLTLGENDENSNQCHKIGHGKPIGLGSVKIIVRSVEERRFDEEGYHLQKEDNVSPKNGETLFDKTILKQICEITNMDACLHSVGYPEMTKSDGSKYTPEEKEKLKNRIASHKWFTMNFQLGKTPNMVLPEIGEQNSEKSLVYDPKKKQQNFKETSANKTDQNIQNSEVIETTVSNIDSWGNVYLDEVKGKIKKNSRIFNRDNNNINLRVGDRIKVIFKNDTTNKNKGKTFHNYKLVE